MSPNSGASSTASQAGDNSQTNGSEHTTTSSILTAWPSKETTEEEQYRWNHYWTSEAAEFEPRVSRFKIDINIIINSNINVDVGFLEIKDKIDVSNPMNLLIKILVEKSINQSTSKLNDEITLARPKLLTNWSNNEPNNTIQLKTSMRIRSRKRTEFWSHLIGSFLNV
jgi:hypothetical protein